MRTGNGTLSKLIYDDTLYHEMRAPLQRVDAMLADLQAGQGTAGKLLKDPALFDEAKQTIGRDPDGCWPTSTPARAPPASC